MELISMLDLIAKFGPQLGAVTSFVLLALIMGNIQKGNAKAREESNEKFERVLNSQMIMKSELEEGQQEMKRDYQEGFIAVHKEINKLAQKVDALEGQQHENNLLALRSIITNVSLPKDYRLASYDTYISKGGNSWVHKYVRKELLQEKDEEL